MSGHGSLSDYDAKKYTMCAPYGGERGDAYEKKFAPEYLTASMSRSDDDQRNDHEEHLRGIDEGGTNDAGILTPFTGATAGNGIDNAERILSKKFHKQRGRETFALLRKHVIRNDIQIAFDALPLKRGRQAWILLKTYGTPHASGILVITKEGKWTGIRMSLVGINLESIILLRGLIDSRGLEQATPKTIEEKRLKFLTLITIPDQLYNMAVDELARPSYLLVAGDSEVVAGLGNVGDPSYDRTVNAFDLKWRLYYEQGHPSMRPTPAVVQNQGARTNRVDANQLVSFSAHTTYDEEYSGNFELPNDAGDEWNAFATSLYNDGGTNEELQFAFEMSTIVGESPCWGCWGWGHRKSECPNPRARNIKDCHAGLQKRISETRSTFGNSEMSRRPVPSSSTQVRNRFMNRGRGRGRSTRFARGGQGRSRGRGRTNSFNVNIDGDTGDAYNEFDEYMGYSLTLNEPSTDANDASTSSASTLPPAPPPTNSTPDPQVHVSSLMRSEPERGAAAAPPNSMASSRSAHLGAPDDWEMGICDTLPLHNYSAKVEYDSDNSNESFAAIPDLVPANTSSDSDDQAAGSNCQTNARKRNHAEQRKRRAANKVVPLSAWHIHCQDLLGHPIPSGTVLPPESIYTMRLSYSQVSPDNSGSPRVFYSGTDFDTTHNKINLWNVTHADVAVCEFLGAKSEVRDGSPSYVWYVPVGVPFGPLGSWMSEEDITAYDVAIDDSRQIAEATRKQLPFVAVPDSGTGRGVVGACTPPDTSTGDGSFIEAEEVIFEQPSFSTSLLMPFKALLTLFVGLIALIGRARPGHIMLLAFLMYAVSYTSASPVPTNSISHMLIPSLLSMYMMQPTVNEMFDHRSMPRGQSLLQRFNYKNAAGDFSYGNPDSGTTKTASGNRKLFPTHLIRTWKPNLRVRVASNATMSVAFIGIMILPTRREPPPKHADAGQLLSFKLGIIDAMYIPGLAATLISTKGLFHNQGIRTYFNDDLHFLLPDGSKIHFDETPTHYAVWVDTTFDANNAQPEDVRAWAAACVPGVDQTHSELCHFSYERIAASAGCTTGKDLSNMVRPKELCRSCVRGGSHKQPAPAVVVCRYTRFGQRVCTDACSMPKSTPFGFEYMITFYDSATSNLAIYFTATVTNAEFQLVFRQFVADHFEDLQYGHVEEFHCDNHGQFCSADMDKFLAWLCTRQSTIVAWNPQQNPAERANSIILRPLRIVLAASNSSERTWPFGATMVAMCHNSLASSSKTCTHPGKSPYQMRTMGRERKAGVKDPVGRIPNLSYFQVPYCAVECTVRAPRDIRGKLAPRTVCGVHLGIDNKRHGYFVYVDAWKRFTTFRFNECTFFPKEFPRCVWITGSHLTEHSEHFLSSEPQQVAAINERVAGQPANHRIDARPSIEEVAQGPGLGCSKCLFSPAGCAACKKPGFIPQVRPEHIVVAQAPADVPAADYDADAHQGPGVVGNREAAVDTAGRRYGPEREPRRLRSQSSSLSCTSDGIATLNDPLSFPLQACNDGRVLCLDLFKLCAAIDVPASFRDSQDTPEAASWRTALVTHMTGKMANHTCDWVPLPDNAKLLKSKIVLTHKYNDDNTIKEFCCRWVGCGYSQIEGEHFDKTFTATAKMTAVRMFLTIILLLKLRPRRGDVSKAYTRAKIDADLFVEQPEPTKSPGLLCKKKDKYGRYYVAKLYKALEGLKQSGHLWQALNTSILISIGFTQLDEEPTIFMMHTSVGIVMALVWIDDYALGFSSAERESFFYTEYNKRDPDRKEGDSTKAPPMIRNEGLLDKFIGIEITWDWRKHTVSLSLANTIERGVARFFTTSSGIPIVKMPHDYDSKDRSSTMSACDFALDDKERDLVNEDHPYMSMVATSLYYSTVLLGYLCHHTSVLSRYMADPNMACVSNVRRVLAYIHYQKDVSITYGGIRFGIPKPIADSSDQKWLDNIIRNFGHFVTCDGSWKIDANYAAHIIMFMGAGLDWSSKLIKVICHSSAEVEVAAACLAAKRQMFIRGLFLRIAQMLGNGSAILLGPTLYLIDNDACIKISDKVGVSKKIEHFLRWQHYFRWVCTHGYGHAVHNAGKIMMADPMTKFTDQTSFLRMVAMFTNNPKNHYLTKDFYTVYKDFNVCVLRLNTVQ